MLGCHGEATQWRKMSVTKPKLVVSLVGTLRYSCLWRKDSDGMFLLFHKQVARDLAPKLTVIFMHLVKRGSFPACWRLVDAVPVPRDLFPRMFENIDLSRLLPFCRRYLRRSWLGS